MQKNEFLTYLDYFISDNASEIASNYRLSDSDSLAQAKREITSDVSDGININGHVLLCIVEQTEVI